MTQGDFQKDIRMVLNQVDLLVLAEEAGAVLRSNNSSVCPLHPGSDNPTAFHLYNGPDGRQRWHCFTRCPEGENDGDVITFYMRWRGVDFKTAVRELRQRVGIDAGHLEKPDQQISGSPSAPQLVTSILQPHSDHWQERMQAFVGYARTQLWSPAGQPVMEYLHDERGLIKETVRTWGLGYNPRDVWQNADAWGLSGKRIWCPRGVVIPGVRDGVIWYAKVRRPLPGDALAEAIGAVDRLPEIKFGGPRGGKMTLFGADHLAGLPVLLLAEGEFDALLAWQAACDLCDVASLGGAKHRLDALDAATLAGAWIVLAVYDVDEAGADGNAYLRSVSKRVVTVEPLAHDLTAYWRQGGDLRAWIASLVAEQMERLLDRLDEHQQQALFIKWLEIYERALAVRAQQ
jgi:hypothetical protein